MYLQGVDNVYDLVWTPGYSYRDMYHQNEVEMSAYNFEHANTEVLFQHFIQFEAEAKRLFEAKLALPGYELVMKCSHTFNLLDARGAISVTERAAYIARVRTLARLAAHAYYASRRERGFERADDDAVKAFISSDELPDVLALRESLNKSAAVS